MDPKEIYSKKKATVFRRLKRDLKDRLGTSIAMAMALDYRWKATVSAQKKNIELAKKFRKSNIFNHNLISFPLLNYLPFDQIATRSFLEIQKEPWSDSGVFSLDTQRLFWTPRFIHLDELFIYYFMQSTQNKKRILMPRATLKQFGKDTHSLTVYNASQQKALQSKIAWNYWASI